jgi:hypothetical protein
MGVGGWRKIGRDTDVCKFGPEGGQGPAWTVRPVDRDRVVVIYVYGTTVTPLRQ